MAYRGGPNRAVGACALIIVMGAGANLGLQSARAQAQIAPSAAQLQPPLVLKRRIAIGRFSNATLYGRALLLPGEQDPLANQAGDMLAARLVETSSSCSNAAISTLSKLRSRWPVVERPLAPTPY
jgi:hypothetical protein